MINQAKSIKMMIYKSTDIVKIIKALLFINLVISCSSREERINDNITNTTSEGTILIVNVDGIAAKGGLLLWPALSVIQKELIHHLP